MRKQVEESTAAESARRATRPAAERDRKGRFRPGVNARRYSGCLRRSLLIGQLHPYNRGGHEESHPPVHLSHEPDRWDGVRYLRV